MRINFNEQERRKILELDVEPLAKYLFRYLKENLGAKNSALFASVDNVWRGMFPGGPHHPSISGYITLLESITLLERRGLVMRDISSSGGRIYNKFIIYLTSIGAKSDFDDEVLLLVDKPEEIVGALEQKVGSLDEVVRQYYLESLRAYQEGLYISSVICLGAASERAIHWLAESIESYSEQYQAKIESRRNGNIFRLTEYLSNTVIPNIFGTDRKFEEELKDRLNGLGKLCRENRNEAGHPQTIDQSWLEEDQEILLIHFRRYITTICEAIGRIT